MDKFWQLFFFSSICMLEFFFKKSCNLIWRNFFFCQIMHYNVRIFFIALWILILENFNIDESPVKNDFWKNYHSLLLGNSTNLESLFEWVSNSIKFQKSAFLVINLINVIKLTMEDIYLQSSGGSKSQNWYVSFLLRRLHHGRGSDLTFLADTTVVSFDITTLQVTNLK